MNVAPIQPKLNTIQRILSNPKAAAFAQNTVCAIAVETTLKATGRPLFIYHDKNANPQSKKYAATKEFLYQSFCLGLYLGFINPIKKFVYDKMSKWQAGKDPENKRKIDLYNAFQYKIGKAPDKESKKALEAKLGELLHTNKDYRFGKGLKELSAIVSTVFILAGCAPVLSQIILHPVMDLIFGKGNKNQKNQPAKTAQAKA
ncbi:MAG TPA: hypothetical protein DEO94_05415 [Cyanobacteria bacterium UBA11991]|nr:hypothetical protein [Cyanobacteriota bacterium]MDY6358758.1 hypothetical protein [Cyanobacteriota bacterium]MDY6363331.1 hypothetical protein [Cyanobacteriota bacterium]MDY6383763.1 hypothetical protein [Cyanobacteriota bacterium]HCB11558.1 hypothetical protein [Cyanobacteria bacterium UBA11991]